MNKLLSHVARFLKGPTPPPMPREFGVEFLEWQTRWNPSLGVRAAAAKILARKYARDADEARLRRIIREELTESAKS